MPVEAGHTSEGGCADTGRDTLRELGSALRGQGPVAASGDRGAGDPPGGEDLGVLGGEGELVKELGVGPVKGVRVSAADGRGARVVGDRGVVDGAGVGVTVEPEVNTGAVGAVLAAGVDATAHGRGSVVAGGAPVRPPDGP